MGRRQVEIQHPPETGSTSSSHHIASRIAQVRVPNAAGNGQLGPVVITTQTSDLPHFDVHGKWADRVIHHHYTNLRLDVLGGTGPTRLVIITA